ncbi:TATA box-binding protein-like protein 1 [Larimichthys crocea]|uniref:Uncharacterized protein n=1 Tax=Larimichthys crocea TaxID=215358 RepID=A0ACD3QYW9_LARCR|nr:TATA box-binding protein-like protein 1 [Larimichthys crocea]
MDSSNDDALDIIITNVVATFRTRCHLNLRTIALEGINVIYKPELGKVLMKLRKPKITASIWSSGKIICTGATSEDEAKLGARRLARCLQKLGFKDQTCRMWPQLLSRSTHFCSSVGNPSAKVKRLKKRRDREVASNLFVTSDEAPYPRIYLLDFYRSTATAANF